MKRELPLTSTDYAKFAVAGAVCTSFIRTALSPLELIKTQLQLAPDGFYSSDGGAAAVVSGARFGTGDGGDWGGEGLESGEGGLAGNGEERETDVGSGGGGGGGGEPEWLVCARDLVIKGAIAARAQDSEAQASKGMGNDGNASNKDRRHGRKDDVRAHTATYRGGSRGDLAVVAGDESETTWSLSGIRSLFRGSLGYQQDRTRLNFLRRNTTATITIVTTIFTFLHSF